MYATLEQFLQYEPDMTADDYNKYSWSATKWVDNVTTGIDGVKKLRVAFPSDEASAETVSRCFCAVIRALKEVDDARAAQASASGYISTENGFQPAAVKSISAGGESITFGTDATSDLAKAASSMSGMKSYINGIVDNYLRGVQDDNGVNLLFGGFYPYEVE